MIKILSYIFIGVLSVSIWACTNTPQQDAAVETTPADVQVNTPSHLAQLPSVPKERMVMLWDSCDYVDVVFYELNFSLSQNTQGSVRSMINNISDATVEIKSGCPAIGRIFFQVDGRNEMECDLFFNEKCQYVIFYEDGKQAYANPLSEQGFKFFSNLFKQVQNAGQGNK